MRSRYANIMRAAQIILGVTLGTTILALGVTLAQLRQTKAELKHQASTGTHAQIRQWVIRQHLMRAKDSPVIVLGDSITEAAPLPPSICGHVVINAGVGGASVASTLAAFPSILGEARNGEQGGTQAALIVTALGTNDAYPTTSESTFRANYAHLLEIAGQHAQHLAVAGVPSIDPKGALTVDAGLSAHVADGLNNALPAVAASAHASFIDMRGEEMSTNDGVHLSPAGYERWASVMALGMEKALECASD
ncbi:SGNH/GDSL hydrolase family protein [Bradyrhizobium genosp. P]|uniref:SGNH/GDSL hydrolase family protein n=1 Tax=Bradyrhizobium genosp. P TaxID=83641 RepID=UPI003CF06E79